MDKLINKGSDSIRHSLHAASELHQQLTELAAPLEKAVEHLVRAYRNTGKLIVFGNGGSAADAQHIAAEMLGKFRLKRRALPAIALTTNTSALTAIGNDFGYEEIFSRQLEAWAQRGDVVIGITTSGASPNVLRALSAARELGAIAVAMTGNTTERIAPLSDILLSVPSDDTPRIQEVHILLGHILCEETERRYFEGEQ